jgi:hypothetical protein
MSSAASAAPIMPPTGTPTWIPPIASERYLFGANSAMSAVAVVSAPPRPMPVMSRQSANVMTLVAVAASNVAAPNSAVLRMSELRRPQRSPSAPMPAAPIAMPTREAASAGPSAARSTPRSATRAGAAKPAAWMSKPSRISVHAAHSRTTRAGFFMSAIRRGFTAVTSEASHKSLRHFSRLRA